MKSKSLIMLNRLILLIYDASCSLKRTGIRFIADSLHPDVCCAHDHLPADPLRFDCCGKWVCSSWSLLTLESMSSITTMSYSLSRYQQSSMLQMIHLSFNKTTLHLIVSRTPLNCYSKKRWSSLVLISGLQTAQTWIQCWIIRSGVLCSRECMNVVWTVSMSWSSGSLGSGTVNSRTLLMRPSTSGESDLECACVRADGQHFEYLLWAHVTEKSHGQIKYK